jgi:hypothetical protein
MTGDKVIRNLTAAAVLVVASIAAVVSFIHIYALARSHGQDHLAAALIPVSLDGTVAAASLVLLWSARRGLHAPGLAQFMLALSVGCTLAANVGYGARYGVTGALISGWPAAGFVGAVEMLLGMVRRARPEDPAGEPEAVVPPMVAGNVEEAARAAYIASVAASNPISQRQLMARFKLSRAAAARVRQSVAAEANGQESRRVPSQSGAMGRP